METLASKATVLADRSALHLVKRFRHTKDQSLIRDEYDSLTTFRFVIRQIIV